MSRSMEARPSHKEATPPAAAVATPRREMSVEKKDASPQPSATPKTGSLSKLPTTSEAVPKAPASGLKAPMTTSASKATPPEKPAADVAAPASKVPQVKPTKVGCLCPDMIRGMVAACRALAEHRS